MIRTVVLFHWINYYIYLIVYNARSTPRCWHQIIQGLKQHETCSYSYKLPLCNNILITCIIHCVYYVILPATLHCVAIAYCANDVFFSACIHNSFLSDYFSISCIFYFFVARPSVCFFIYFSGIWPLWYFRTLFPEGIATCSISIFV